MVETVKATQPDRAARRREQRRALIVAATEEELAESGPDGTTLASVGDRVGLSKGALYYYVDGRDSLFALVLDEVLRDIRRDAVDRAGDDPSPLDELSAFARAHVHAAVERPAGLLVISNVDHLAAREDDASLLREHEAALRDIVRRGVEAGVLRGIDPMIGSTTLFGALNALCRAFDPEGPLGLDEMIDAVLDLLVEGWRASS